VARPRKLLDDSEIQRRLEAGQSLRSIAKFFGVDKNSITRRMPKPVAGEPEVPKPHGLNDVPSGTKDLFLVCGSLNWQYCGGYRPNVIALGIDEWHENYSSLPAIRNAERIWVVITNDDENPGEDNDRFVRSLAASSVRDKCLFSAEGVRATAKARYWHIQKAYPAFGDEAMFTNLYHFQPLPVTG
jgi:hypothetical protein